MARTVDARGLSCPQPVILTRNAIKAGEFPVEVLVDTVTARENVRRMAEKQSCRVQVEEAGDEFRLVLTR
ncbi:MAG: SirA family protein [Chloroflexi bacterium]|nr:SirA family protein [Chloroflexota bacterium]